MTAHEEISRTVGMVPAPGSAPGTAPGPAPAPARAWPVDGAGYFYPQTAGGVPLSVFAFGFSVGMLGLLNTGILDGRAAAMFVPVAMGTGALGLLIGGLWDFRANNQFGGTFGVAYALFLFTTGLMLHFFAPPVIAAAGANAFGDVFGAWLILWAIFTGLLAIGARTINLPAFLAFTLLIVVYVALGLASIAGGASYAPTLTKIGGWFALADGVAAWYLGAGLLLNATVGRQLFPLWPYRAA